MYVSDSTSSGKVAQMCLEGPSRRCLVVLSLGKIVLRFLLLDFCRFYVGFFKSTNIVFDAVSSTLGFMFQWMVLLEV